MRRMRPVCWVALLWAAGACDDGGFDNPCDPQNAAADQCQTDGAVDGAIDQGGLDMPRVDRDRGGSDGAVPDMRAPDMIQPDLAVIDMRPPDRSMADMRPPDQGMPDQGMPDQGPPAPTDSVCAMGEVSADCLARDCNQMGCEPGPICDPESGTCLPPGPGDCQVQGCLNAFYCGLQGHCIERCETAGCPAGKRCDYNTSRCIPAGGACQTHGFDLGCVNANQQFECEKLGGQWGVWVDRGDNECKCPAPDAGCPCRSHDDCSGAGMCMVPADVERICRVGVRSRCAPSNFPEVCQCNGQRFPDGRMTDEMPALICPP